jgi:hypothetical protein
MPENQRRSQPPAARAEDFGLALRGANADNAGNDEDVRAKDGHVWGKDVTANSHQLINICARAG